MARLFVVVFVICIIATVASAQTTTVISTSPIAQPAPAPAAPAMIVTSPFRPLPAAGAGMPVSTTTVTTTTAPVLQATPAIAPASGLNKVFNDADMNRDNAVSRQEFLSEAERQFGTADNNKDGRITRDEMQAKQSQVLQNAFGSGNWQQKIQGFIGGATPAPTPRLVAPIVPVVTPPSAPVVPSADGY